MEHASQYPSNSNPEPTKPNLQAVPAEPKPKVVKRIVSAPVEQKKRGLGRAFIEFFGGGDGRSVGEYVIVGIVAPAIQQMLFQIANQGMTAAQRSITNSINRGFNGFNQQQYPQHPHPIVGNYVQQNTPYNRMGNTGYPQPAQSPLISPAGRRMHNFDEIIIQDINEANAAIEYLRGFLDDYPNVSVADLYQIIGIKPDPSGVDNQYGWTNLDNARVINAGHGFRLGLPRPIPLVNYQY